MTKYIPTGNEMISLPKINESTAAIEDVTFLSMAHKGMIELRGGSEMPLLRPFFSAGPLTELAWSREHYWIPRMTAMAGRLKTEMVILPPIGERGFAVRLSVTTGEDTDLDWGMEGCWGSAWHCVNEDKPLEGSMHCYESGWNSSVIFDFRSGGPAFAFAPMTDRPCETSFSKQEDGIHYALTCREHFCAGETRTLTFFWGFGFEEVAAATSAKEMLRRTWDWEYGKTVRWLMQREAKLHTEKLTEIYNTNLFFCIFFSTGITMDTEELICATSRSTRYYVSAAYWDRDTLLWAFPSILAADPALARQVLDYIFTRQIRNVGIHSRYIDGVVLEPGFELDELMAPILALESYVDAAGDRDILSEPSVKNGVDSILRKLSDHRHDSIALYETFLQPTDDEIVHPYLTYDNMLVWKALRAIARLYPMHGECLTESEAVKAAIYENCVFTDANGKPYFGWSVDLEGHHDVYDEPPGSLQLLPYYGFCEADDPIWQNTVAMIRSEEYAYSFAGSPIAEIGCPHAPYPWVLSLCNSLLTGHEAQTWRELEHMEMDNGIACESVDADSGVCTTGAAFATCAGFLCHGMITAERRYRHAE